MKPSETIFVEEEAVRPTHVEVDFGALGANLAAIRSHVGRARVMPILKANAYGHGLVAVARHMVTLGADYLGVAFLEEGILLRKQGIQTPILVLGGIAGEQIPLFLRHGLTLTAPSVEKLKLIDEAAASLGVRARVHLKVDTGMERIGIHYYNASRLLEESLSCGHVEVEGIFSHFANADAAD
ncbi:MAG TPA: alanine racemase, partial [Prosthecobacter sp.]